MGGSLLLGSIAGRGRSPGRAHSRAPFLAAHERRRRPLAASSSDRSPPPPALLSPPLLSSPSSPLLFAANPLTCSILGSQLETGPCGSLASTFRDLAAKYAAADDCAAFAPNGPLKGVPQPNDACCSQLRSFASNGCGCDAVTSSLARAFLGGAAGSADSAIAGGIRLAQASRCSSDALGGPIVNACDGSIGCPAAAPAAAAPTAKPATKPAAGAAP